MCLYVPGCVRKKSKLLKASHSCISLRGITCWKTDRKETKLLWIGWWISSCFALKTCYLADNSQISLNRPSKKIFHLFSVMDYQNVLIVNLKALLVVFHAVVNRKQWLLRIPEISTMKTSSMVVLIGTTALQKKKPLAFFCCAVVGFFTSSNQ